MVITAIGMIMPGTPETLMVALAVPGLTVVLAVPGPMVVSAQFRTTKTAATSIPPTILCMVNGLLPTAYRSTVAPMAHGTTVEAPLLCGVPRPCRHNLTTTPVQVQPPERHLRKLNRMVARVTGREIAAPNIECNEIARAVL